MSKIPEVEFLYVRYLFICAWAVHKPIGFLQYKTGVDRLNEMARLTLKRPT